VCQGALRKGCPSNKVSGRRCATSTIALTLIELLLQEVVMCKDNDKPRLLEDNLLRVEEKRVIVFVNTKNHCDAVSRQLDQLGFSCTVLHGGKTQACLPLSLFK